MRSSLFLFSTFLTLTFFTSCKKDKPKDPQIITTVAKSISASKCLATASVPEKGDYEVLDYGFVYSYNDMPFGIGINNTISLGSHLTSDTFSTTFAYSFQYYYNQNIYVRAYLTNKKGTVYGNIMMFKPLILELTSINPTSGKKGDTITLYGYNFDPIPENNIVKFNNYTAKVNEASTTRLVVEVPQLDSYSYYYTVYVTVGDQNVNYNYFYFNNN